jgi:sortase A
MKISPRKILPLLLLGSGLFLLANVFFSLGLDTFSLYLFQQPPLLDPTAVAEHPAPVIVNILGAATVDYTMAGSWFDAPASPASAPVTSPVKYFTLAIPRLKLENVSVEVNGTDLKKNAIHYPGTALPGDFGNSVIFGHSALPQFYKTGNPLTIFNPLVKAKVGDEIVVHFDGVTYHYLIKKTVIVKASAVEVLAQHYDRRSLTLITCTPLGTYWYRFVAQADLEN